MQHIKLGTRGSRLALWQAQYAAYCLKKACPDVSIDIIVIKTKGDKILDVPLSRIGDKGLFTSEIENELLDGKIDVAVHSLKDLPSQLAPGLGLVAVLKREDPRDVLLSGKGYRLSNLPQGARVGTSSLRRIAQIKAVRPDIRIVDLRGNVETRIRKMEEQDLDAIVLAYAGVKRLGFEERITDFVSPRIILPAVGQGVIALEARQDDSSTRNCLNQINDLDAYVETSAERAFLNELQGGCQVPIAALGNISGDVIILEGLVSSLDGKIIYRSQEKGIRDAASEVGRRLAQRLLKQGADAILAEIERLGE
jgi:hydroxymethylbilane synthase